MLFHHVRPSLAGPGEPVPYWVTVAMGWVFGNSALGITWYSLNEEFGALYTQYYLEADA